MGEYHLKKLKRQNRNTKAKGNFYKENVNI